MKSETAYKIIQLHRKSINFLTALMPTLEGLYLATVLDGKKGIVQLSFSVNVEHVINDMFKALSGQFPDDPGWACGEAVQGANIESETVLKGDLGNETQ